MKKLVIFLLILSCFSVANGQSKKQLKIELKRLKADSAVTVDQLKSATNEKDKLKGQLDKISPVEVDDNITPNEQPLGVVIGESGWRTELNRLKYKSDLIGQLGTIWIADSNNQIQPQGGILLSKYNIDPILINPEKDVIYKKFISKGTKLEGEGGASFVNIKAGIQKDKYAQFIINIDGTSLIKPQYDDLKKMAQNVKELFDIKKSKGVYLCTGMHVVKYNAKIYSNTTASANITTPVVKIGGDFYAESNEESTDYFVARQLTRLNKPTIADTSNINTAVSRIAATKSIKDFNLKASNLSSQELLYYYLQREPTFDEIVKFQDSPEDFVKSDSTINKSFTEKDDLLLKQVIENTNTLDNEIESTNQKLF